MTGLEQFTDDELLPLSALQHLHFCERQCALIHIEQVWADNPLTLEGSHLHERVHEMAPRRELRGDLLTVRGVPLRSLRLGLTGRADVVEFRRRPADSFSSGAVGDLPRGVPLAGVDGLWQPFPVEYKRGRPKSDQCDEVQLCAQALCLEEMIKVDVPEGALYCGAEKHRRSVSFDPQLRDETVATAHRLHVLFESGQTPTAKREPKCRNCSLLGLCLPEVLGRRRSVRRYLSSALDADDATGERG